MRIKAVEISTAFLLFDALAKNHFLLNIFQKKWLKNLHSYKNSHTFASHLRDNPNDDSLAQLVEHNTFNVGVLGSSPRRITRELKSKLQFSFFIHSKFQLECFFCVLFRYPNKFYYFCLHIINCYANQHHR